MERLLETVLGSFLSDYVSSSKETRDGNLRAHLSSSGISLHDIEFNTSRVNSGDIDVEKATASALEVKVPWSSLTTQSIEIHLTDVEVSLCKKPTSSSQTLVDTPNKQAGMETQSEDNGSRQDGQSWLSVNIQSRLLRHAVNLSVFIKKMLVQYKYDCFVISCKMESVSLVNIPDNEWMGLVKDPNVWLGKGLLGQGMKIVMEKDGHLLGTAVIESLQLSCLLPLFSFWNKESGSNEQKMMPILGEISSVDFEIADEIFSTFRELQTNTLSKMNNHQNGNPHDIRSKKEIEIVKWIKEVKIEEYNWLLDIGLTIGRCKMDILWREHTDAVPCRVVLFLDHVIFHSESNVECLEILFAIESYVLDILSEDSMLRSCIFKGVPAELCPGSQGISAIFSMPEGKQGSFNLALGDVGLTLPWEWIDVIDNWVLLWKQCFPPESGSSKEMPLDALGAISVLAYSINLGISFENRRLSVAIDELKLDGDFMDASLGFEMHVCFQDSISSPSGEDAVETTLSNQIKVLVKKDASELSFSSGVVSITLLDLAVMSHLYSCIFGEYNKDISDLNLTSIPFSVALGSSEIQSSIDLKNGEIMFCTRLHASLAIGNTKACLSTGEMSCRFSSGIMQIDTSILRLVVTEKDFNTSYLDLNLSGLLLDRNTEKKRLSVSNASLDTRVQSLDLEPLFRCLFCLWSGKNVPITSVELSSEFEIETATITTCIEDTKLAIWLSGINFARCGDDESIVIMNFGANIEPSMQRSIPILLLKRKCAQVNALTFQRSRKDTEIVVKITVADFELNLLPIMTCLFQGLIVVKESLVNCHKNATYHLIRAKANLDRVSTKIQIDSADIFFYHALHDSCYIKINLWKCEIEYVQNELMLDRFWLDASLQGEMDGKMAISVDDVSVFLTDCAAKESRLLLPFSFELILSTWPIGNKKCVHVRTSPLVLNLDTSSIRDIISVFGNYTPGIEFPPGPQNRILENLTKHDLNSTPCLYLPVATEKDFGRDFPAQVILHSFLENSFSWIYRHPRMLTGVSIQGMSLCQGVDFLNFTLIGMNATGHGESVVTFDINGLNKSVTFTDLGYYDSWKLVWNNPLDSLSWIDLSRCIILNSQAKQRDRLSMPEFEFTHATPKISVLFHSVGCTGRINQNQDCSFNRIIGEFCAQSCTTTVKSNAGEIESNCSLGSLSVNYTDPFDCSPVTFITGSELSISYIRELSSHEKASSDWIRGIKSTSLDGTCYATSVHESDNTSREVLIDSKDGVKILLTNFLYHDFLYLWDAASRSTMDHCLIVENQLSCSISMKQSEDAEEISINGRGHKSYFLKYNKPRLLQFNFGVEQENTQSDWTEPINVFSEPKGIRTISSSQYVARISFRRDKYLYIMVNNGAQLINSTSSDIELKMGQEEKFLTSGKGIDFFNLNVLVRIKLLEGWSDAISLYSESKRVTCYEIHCGSGKTLLINRDFDSEAPVYHICYPVTLTSFLSETVRISNMTNTFTLIRNESADLSLHVAGGPLAHICLSSDGKETESQVLFCPGYGMPEETTPAAPVVSETVSMVPEPGSSNILKFSYPTSERQTEVVLLSDLTSHRTLKVFLSPELTLKNATTKPAIFSISSSDYHISPDSSLGVETGGISMQVSIVFLDRQGNSCTAQTSKFDISMEMEGPFDAISSDKKRSFKIMVAISHEMGRSQVTVTPYIFITNLTDYYLCDGLGEIYQTGYSGPFMTLTDMDSGNFTLRQSKVRHDGSLLNVDSHKFSLNESSTHLNEGGDLSYSVVRKFDRIHFIIKNERQKITLYNSLEEDARLIFLTRDLELLRSIYVICGSKHEVSLQKADEILRVTIGQQSHDVPVSEIRIGSILQIGDALIYRPRKDSVEIRKREEKLDVSLLSIRLCMSGIRLFIYQNPRCKGDQVGLCMDFDDLDGTLRYGLIPGFFMGTLKVAEHRVSLPCNSGNPAITFGSMSGFNVEMEAFLGSQSKTIEYVAIQCAQSNIRLDDQILAMFLRLSGPSDSSVKHNISMSEALSSEAENFMDSSFLVRRFIFQGISVDCDVHLSKSPWLPIAIDASRARLAIAKFDHRCQSTLDSLGRALKDHFADCLVRSAPYLFGSLQVLFDPVGLVRSVRKGVFDMVRLPLQGLQKGSFTSFLSGLGYGSATFLREISSWSIGASIGFSRAMVKLVLNEKGGSSLTDPSESGEGPDLRMSQMALHMTYEECLASGCDLLWYSDLSDAKISLRDGIRVTLKILDPVILVHTRDPTVMERDHIHWTFS